MADEEYVPDDPEDDVEPEGTLEPSVADPDEVVGGNGAPVESDDDGSLVDPGTVTDDAVRTPDGYEQATNGSEAGEEPDQTVPVEEPPLPAPTYVTETRATDVIIDDYSAASLASYEQSGATAIAVLDDGTELEVQWSEVFDPRPMPVVASFDVAAVAAAKNQHFWHDDGGAHVTDEEQDDWNDEYAMVDHGTLANPTTARPWHNILMNSLGILLRSGVRDLSSFSKSGVAFFDGNGNNAANIVATFGVQGAQIGKSSAEHVVIDEHGLSAYDGQGNLIPANAVIDGANITNASITGAKIRGSTLTDIPFAELDVVKAGTISAADIAADHAAVGSLGATYARVDAANLGTATARAAWVDQLMVQSGLLAHTGAVYELDAVQVNASSITAGTLDVERLVVTGQDGHKYLVHVEGGTTSYEKLDGDVIEDLTITADKIVAGAVTAEKITTENIVGSGGWINLRSGTFRYVNATTGQGIAWDGSNLTISGSVTVGGSPVALEQIAQDATNTLIYDHSYQLDASGENATFTAYLYRGGVDVKAEYDPEQFLWYYKTESDDTLHPIGTGYGYTCTVSLALMGYGGHVVGKFVQQADSDLLTSNDEGLQDSDGDQLTVQTPVADGSVRIGDLQVATRVAATDKLLVSDQEGEHLATIETLQGYIESRMPKHVLFGTTAQWDAQVSLESVAETLYVYTDHATDSQGNQIAGIKVGDGSAYLIDLPFTDTVMMEHVADNVRHVTAQERAFWNEKVRCYMGGSESLVFTTG